ncbi:Hypothetical predicted protein [Mytilus galloprovincialis]|uniref:Uncharacterized protein n=1 Tax=Mytilus galloprovincialis TaxID=29158 RepID=A0A8B6HHS5_MYTGA|nr:Hypothetical predicted protein [Mytilus galloprovincialis]
MLECFERREVYMATRQGIRDTSRHPRERNIKKPRKNKERLTFVNFVKEGEKGQKKKVEGSGLLVTATDWQMLVDLKQKLQFPPQIAVTNQRPDIVIWSASTKQAILLELTVPWEERIEDAYERKRLKYQDLLAECRDNGWRVWLFPVEVGSRGFVGQSMWRALRALGRSSIDVVMGKKVRTVEAESVEAGMDSHMVSGWDLITPVGAPLEVVVDSAETAEEGGFT